MIHEKIKQIGNRTEIEWEKICYRYKINFIAELGIRTKLYYLVLFPKAEETAQRIKSFLRENPVRKGIFTHWSSVNTKRAFLRHFGNHNRNK